MRIAVIGGGINGIMTSWALAKAGHSVDLYEKNKLMTATSSASTKLLHGGLRYFEQGQFRLVYEALRERAWWINAAPHLASPIQLILPVYRNLARPAWKIKAGLVLYDLLAGRLNLGRHQWHTRDELINISPMLKTDSLSGGFTFYDGQMDDLNLGLWAAQQASNAGVLIHENAPVERVDLDAGITINGNRIKYDFVVNIAGPWAKQLLNRSYINSTNELDLVRGSHVLIDEPLDHGYLLQVPEEKRICFVLPYFGQTLVGTTEVRQTLDQPITCSDEEAVYLLNIYNFYFQTSKGISDIYKRFSGVRPLIRTNDDPNKASREYVIEKKGRLITVFGGKWTTSRALGYKVAKEIGG